MPGSDTASPQLPRPAQLSWQRPFHLLCCAVLRRQVSRPEKVEEVVVHRRLADRVSSILHRIEKVGTALGRQLNVLRASQ